MTETTISGWEIHQIINIWALWKEGKKEATEALENIGIYLGVS